MHLRFQLVKRTTLLALATICTVSGVGGAAMSASADQPPAYHIDCSAKRSGDGSESAPWNSLAKPSTHGPFSAGDRILLKRGTVCAGSLRPAGSGASGSPITIGAYGKAKALPTINGNGTRTGSGAVELHDQSYWTIQDLHLTNRDSQKETRSYRAGVLLTNSGTARSAGITVQRLQVDKVVSNLAANNVDPREYGGIAAITTSAAPGRGGFDRLRILNNRVVGVGRTGIVVSNHGYPSTHDSDLRIGGNHVQEARGDSIIVRGSVNALIDHNVSARGADFWPCKQCGDISPETANAGIWPATSKNTLIEYNEVYGTRKLGGDGVGLDVDLSAVNTVVQYNYVHDNEGGGILFCGSSHTTARFNILENNARAAFVFIGSIPAIDTKIYNNTVYMKRGVSARVMHTQGNRGGKKLSFTNNLIYNFDDSGYYVWPMKYTSRSNTYIGVHGLGEPNEYAKEYVDPGLRSPGSGRNGFSTLGGYHPSSPKGDSFGSPIPNSVKTDIFGKKINPKKPPRGAAG